MLGLGNRNPKGGKTPVQRLDIRGLLGLARSNLLCRPGVGQAVHDAITAPGTQRLLKSYPREYPRSMSVATPWLCAQYMDIQREAAGGVELAAARFSPSEDFDCPRVK